ncbi:MAG: hypothetical protein ACLP9S_14580 [Syntrophales bacterium]
MRKHFLTQDLVRLEFGETITKVSSKSPAIGSTDQPTHAARLPLLCNTHITGRKVGFGEKPLGHHEAEFGLIHTSLLDI